MRFFMTCIYLLVWPSIAKRYCNTFPTLGAKDIDEIIKKHLRLTAPPRAHLCTSYDLRVQTAAQAPLMLSVAR